MKNKKVLFGLIVSAFVGLSCISVAQTKANYNNRLMEIGPDNIAGRVRALVVDQADPTHKTLYAGGVAGGLYKMQTEEFMWNYMPCYKNGKEVTLPISCMVQGPDNKLYIGTGEGLAVGENANSAFIVPKGSGLYCFNPADTSFTVVAGTEGWSYINQVTYLYRNGNLFFYAATNDGLYRWRVNGSMSLSGAPELVFSDGPVQDIEIVSGDNMAFFTSGSHIYKISNVTNPAQTGTKYTDISSSCPAFGGDALRIELTSAKSDRTYLYAMVANAQGMLDAVYLTHNQQTWNRLTTATITPFDANNTGWHNNTVTVNPQNHKNIFIGGATIWSGEGFVENSYYQWNKVSYTETELNAGNYMEAVYPNPMFVHSGIHAIVPTFETDPVTGDTMWVYYIATDGGVYRTIDFTSFASYNKGLNTVQFNGIAVAPDGSVVGGATDNACPFIQARLEHHAGDVNHTWYDNGSTQNHIANVLWFGDGGQVEASMFQQVLPQSRRGLFFSSTGGDFAISGSFGTQSIANFGRAYADYADYNNTQTWTIGAAYLEKSIASTNLHPQMSLWETLNNEGFDSITFNIDTLGVFYRNNTEISFADTSALLRISPDPSNPKYRWAANVQIQAGDKIIVGSKPHFNYPFTHVFNSSFKIIDTNYVNDSIVVRVNGNDTIWRDTTYRIPYTNLQQKVHDPIASRMFVSGKNTNGQGVVRMTKSSTDYSKVWTAEDAGTSITMHWYDIFAAPGGSGHAFQSTGYTAVSNNGDAVFINVIDTLGKHFVIRISNMNAATGQTYVKLNAQLNYQGTYPDMPRITHMDTIMLSGDNYNFDRPITSMYVDRRANKDMLLITFGGDTTTPNVYVVNNANNPATRTITGQVVNNGRPVYSGIIEYTTGTIYVGTGDGVFTTSESSFSGTPTWVAYGAFNGVPVTSIRQQVNTLKRERYTSHTGINEEVYLFAKTKYPYAMYFGTYGRGVFMDMQYVTDTVNEIVDSADFVGITTVDNGTNSISVYPNPASNYTTIQMDVETPANTVLKVYDLSGRLVYSENLGVVNEGRSLYRLNCQNLRNGMYLINMNFGRHSATSKLIVR
jgi:hypothetical protein